MRLGILTQPLHDNYGGLLQAYALKTTLERLGHQVEIVNRRRGNIGVKRRIKLFIKRMIGRSSKFPLTEGQQKIISQHTRSFTQKYIVDITKPVYSTADLKEIASNYDGFVVGSDQCWRPRYSPKISNYFLDFLDNPETLALSYAASFGVDSWEFTEEQTAVCKSNMHKFNAISVREKSAVELCKRHLGTDAVHVLDPTMLLLKDDYIRLIDQEKEKTSTGRLLHYVLDSSEAKESLIEHIAGRLGYEVFSAHQKKKPNASTIKNIEDCVFPKVTTWLQAFKQAEFVVTDSFHGTVFSILFNKPFVVVANMKRGKSRFDSLLDLFGLQDRLISNLDEVDKDDVMKLPEIDWTRVNNIVEERREKSLEFLRENLN